MRSLVKKFGEDRDSFYIDNQNKHASLGLNDVWISIKACSLPGKNVTCKNPFNLPQEKSTVGYEFAGVVEECGTDVTLVDVGDRIAGLLPMDSEYSACAEYCVVEEFNVVKLPKEVSYVEAAAIIGDGLKVFTALHYQGHLCAGDTVLIMNGSTSFGCLAISLAHYWGAKVITTSSSKDEKSFFDEMKPSPAYVIEMNEKNSMLVSCIMEETENIGADIIIDNGVRLFDKNNEFDCIKEDQNFNIPMKHEVISCLGVGGRWITSHPNLQLDPPDSNQLYLKCASLSFLFEHSWILSCSQYGRFQHILKIIMKLLQERIIHPCLDKIISLEESLNLLNSNNVHADKKCVIQIE